MVLDWFAGFGRIDDGRCLAHWVLKLIFEIISDDHVIDVVLNDVDIAIRPHDPHFKGVQQEALFTLEKRLYASSEYIEKYGEHANQPYTDDNKDVVLVG